MRSHLYRMDRNSSQNFGQFYGPSLHDGNMKLLIVMYAFIWALFKQEKLFRGKFETKTKPEKDSAGNAFVYIAG